MRINLSYIKVTAIAFTYLWEETDYVSFIFFNLILFLGRGRYKQLLLCPKMLMFLPIDEVFTMNSL